MSSATDLDLFNKFLEWKAAREHQDVVAEPECEDKASPGTSKEDGTSGSMDDGSDAVAGVLAEDYLMKSTRGQRSSGQVNLHSRKFKVCANQGLI